MRATSAEPLDDIGGCLTLAPTISQIEKSDANSLDFLVHRIPSIAALVAPLLVSRVRRRSVHFDARSVVLVEVVQVPSAGLLPHSGLPLRRRETVRALHAPNITQFKERQSALACFAEREFRFSPPAELRSRVQRVTDPGRSGAPPAYGTANPGIRLVKGRRGLDQVEDCLLHSGTWR